MLGLDWEVVKEFEEGWMGFNGEGIGGVVVMDCEGEVEDEFMI